MKKLANFWKSGPLGKFVLIAAPVVVVCLACVCLVVVGGGVAAWMFLPGLRSNESTALAPPTVIDSLPASAGGGLVQDEFGVSLAVPPDTLESGQQAYLERASLSQGMQREIAKAYQVESLAYAVRLQDGQDGIGNVELALPAPSPDSRLAVLVDGRYLGILETPAQDGVFRINPSLSLAAGVQTYPEPGTAGQDPNYYLVLTPKAGSAQAPRVGGKLASLAAQTDPDGKYCILEFWTVSDCWRNPEGSVYVFWGRDVPENLKADYRKNIINTVKAVTAMMSQYNQKGFTAANISPSNLLYVIVEPGDFSPYYSWKTGNVYVPWDVIGGIGDTKNRCTLAHEIFHFIEDEEYRMGLATAPKRWWLETSAENGTFLLESGCIENNLTTYGKSTTSGNVLGFQAAPLQWDEALYIHALQLYLSICDGGTHCAISEQAWIQAINSGTYPMNSSAETSYEINAKDLGLFLLGAAPVESRVGAFIPSSAKSGENFGDYLNLKAGALRWEFGYTQNQFKQVSDQQVDVKATIAKGGVYPLRMSNGGVTPGGNSMAGLPGLLEIKAGPAFWLKQDNAEPVFNPAGTSLKLGPISDQLGIGKVRIVAIAPDAEQTFQASLSLADFSGDWGVLPGKFVITPIDCPNYDPNKAKDYESLSLVNFFSAYGTYVKDPADPQNANLIWEGTFPEDSLFGSLAATGSSEVTVSPDKLVLHYRIDIPKPTNASSLASWWKPGRILVKEPVLNRSALLSGWLFLPVFAGVVWLHSRRRKWAWLATSIRLVFLAIILSSCLGECDVSVWGTIEGTYTFKKLEYIDPGQAAAAATGDAGSEPTIFWKLSSGEVVDNWDLTVSVKTTDDQGVTTEEVSACKMVLTDSTATGMIGPSDMVPPPDIGE